MYELVANKKGFLSGLIRSRATEVQVVKSFEKLMGKISQNVPNLDAKSIVAIANMGIQIQARANKASIALSLPPTVSHSMLLVDPLNIPPALQNSDKLKEYLNYLKNNNASGKMLSPAAYLTLMQACQDKGLVKEFMDGVGHDKVLQRRVATAFRDKVYIELSKETGKSSYSSTDLVQLLSNHRFQQLM